jgi:UDP-2,3-diacylglucosamine pyrophosphatase LpxH
MSPRPDNGTDSGCNVVVVSDVHLGEDLLPGASGRTSRDVALAEAALADFARHLTRSRMDGRPWRLVVNGDMIDLMVVPDARGHYPFARTAAVAKERIDQVVSHHRAVFAALARFVAAGNRLDVLAGNHDLELVWPEVAAHLGERIAALAPAGAKSIAERIAVRPWFVYEPGLAWIEHGQQYDATCSQEMHLSPDDPRTGAIVDNIDYAAIRHLSGGCPEIDSRATEAWSFGGYLKFAASRGAAGFIQMIVGYGRFVRLLWHSRGAHKSVRIRNARQRAHDARLEQLAEASGVEPQLLRDVDGLKRPPVTMSTRRLMGILMLDRFLLCVGAVVGVLAAMLLLPVGLAVLAMMAVLAATWWGGLQLAKVRNPDNILPLRMAAQRIRARVDAPFIVFGHTHEPIHEALPTGGAYVNSGTWLPAIRPGLLRAFTHVVMRRTPQGPLCELRQWRDGASRRFGSDEVTPVPAPMPVRPASGPVLAPAAVAVAASVAASVPAPVAPASPAPRAETSPERLAPAGDETVAA